MARERVKKVAPGDPKMAVALIRVSTEEQNMGALAQRDAIERWAAREGVAVVATFEERVSGGADWSERVGLLDALAALTEHGAGVLVVAKLDRVARDPINAAYAERMALNAGARIISTAGEATANDDPSSKMTRGILHVIAEWERLVNAARTRAALQAMKARGLRTGNIPYGKRLDDQDPTRVVDDEDEVQALTMAMTLHAQGVSLRGIGRRLAEAGYVSRSGQPYHATQVRRMVGGR